VATLLQGVLLVIAVTQFAFPVLAAYHSTRDIALRALELRQAKEPIVAYGFFHHTLNYYTSYQVAGKLDSPEAAREFAKKHPSFLVVTNARRMPEILSLNGFAAFILDQQGNTRLLRLLQFR